MGHSRFEQTASGMAMAGDAGAAVEFGLRPDLTPDELRRVHRKLVRRYHPDLGGSKGHADALARINAAYDALRRSAAEPPEVGSRSPSTAPYRPWPEAAQPAPEPESRTRTAAPRSEAKHEPQPQKQPKKQPQPTSKPAPTADVEPESLTILEMDQRGKRIMGRMVLAALDDWLEARQGVPRAPFKRRLSCLTGLRRPIPRPGLQVPDRVVLQSDALCLHFGGRVVDGPNILILPGLKIGAGGRLEATGGMRAILRTYSDGQTEADMSADDARGYDIGLRLRSGDLPVRLQFDAEGGDAGAALCARAGNRYRGLFLPE